MPEAGKTTGGGRKGTWTVGAWNDGDLPDETSLEVLEQVADAAWEEAGLHSMLRAAHTGDLEEILHNARAPLHTSDGSVEGLLERVKLSRSLEDDPDFQAARRGVSQVPAMSGSRPHSRASRPVHPDGADMSAATLFDVLRRTQSQQVTLVETNRAPMTVSRIEMAMLRQGDAQQGGSNQHWGAVLRLMESQRVRDYLFQQGLLLSPIARPISPGRRASGSSSGGSQRQRRSLTAPPQRVGPHKNAAGIYVGQATPTRDVAIPWGKATKSPGSRYFNYSSLDECLGFAPPSFPEELRTEMEEPSAPSRPMRRRKAKAKIADQREYHSARMTTPHQRQFRERPGTSSMRQSTYNGWMPSSPAPNLMRSNSNASPSASFGQYGEMRRPVTSPQMGEDMGRRPADGISRRLHLHLGHRGTGSATGRHSLAQTPAHRPQSQQTSRPPQVPSLHHAMRGMQAAAGAGRPSTSPASPSMQEMRNAWPASRRPDCSQIGADDTQQWQNDAALEDYSWKGFSPSSARRQRSTEVPSGRTASHAHASALGAIPPAAPNAPKTAAMKVFDFGGLTGGRANPAPSALPASSRMDKLVAAAAAGSSSATGNGSRYRHNVAAAGQAYSAGFGFSGLQIRSQPMRQRYQSTA
eukprot:jgi/Tetstr1/441247/TSEL_029499.t1